MEHKDEGVATIFIENALIEDIRLETDTDSFIDFDGRVRYMPPNLNKYALRFATPDKIIFDNPIKIKNGPYEILIMIREKQ